MKGERRWWWTRSVSNCAPSEFRVILYPFNYLENKTTFDLNFEMALFCFWLVPLLFPIIDWWIRRLIRRRRKKERTRKKKEESLISLDGLHKKEIERTIGSVFFFFNWASDREWPGPLTLALVGCNGGGRDSFFRHHRVTAILFYFIFSFLHIQRESQYFT